MTPEFHIDDKYKLEYQWIYGSSDKSWKFSDLSKNHSQVHTLDEWFCQYPMYEAHLSWKLKSQQYAEKEKVWQALINQVFLDIQEILHTSPGQ